MHKVLLAIPFVFFAAQASAACTQQDLQTKATEMMTVVQQLAAKNPQAAQDWSTKTQKAVQEMQTKIKPDDYDAACKFYDDLIADAKKGL